MQKKYMDAPTETIRWQVLVLKHDKALLQLKSGYQSTIQKFNHLYVQDAIKK
jgi:hypothetical protein